MTKKVLLIVTALLALGSLALADTISGGVFNGVPSNFNTTTPGPGVQGNPFWNDASLDGLNLNVGYILAGANAGAGLNTNFLTNNATAGNYLAASGGSPNAVNSFNLVREALSVTVTLLYSNSAANQVKTGIFASKTVGFYDTSCVDPTLSACRQVLYNGNIADVSNLTAGGQVNNNVSTAFANYGLFMTTCLGSTAGSCYTAYSNSALNGSGETAHQHFALFQNAQNSRLYYIGIEDGLANNATEVFGDFNDVVLQISTSAVASTPEPATLSIVGLGLLGLGLVRRVRK